MWQGLQTIKDCKGKTSHVKDTDLFLPDKLNTFFTRSEDNTVPQTRPSTKDCGLLLTEATEKKTFKHVNPQKAASPDGKPHPQS